MIIEPCRINVFPPQTDVTCEVFNISSSCSGHKWKQGMWSKEEIDILISNIDRYVKVLSVFVAPADVVSACFTYFVWLDVCVCVSGPRHWRPSRDHFWDVQRGEEGFLPLCGFGPQQAAVRRLQTSPTNVRQPKPRRQVSQWGKDVRKHVTTLFSQFK